MSATEKDKPSNLFHYLRLQLTDSENRGLHRVDQYPNPNKPSALQHEYAKWDWQVSLVYKNNRVSIRAEMARSATGPHITNIVLFCLASLTIGF